MTKIELKNLLQMVKATYQSFSPTKETCEVWYRAFREIDFEEAEAAFLEYGKEGHERAPNWGSILTRTKTVRNATTSLSNYFKGTEEHEASYWESRAEEGLVRVYQTWNGRLVSFFAPSELHKITGYKTINGKKLPYSDETDSPKNIDPRNASAMFHSAYPGYVEPDVF